jgi:hypothetical protein
MTKKKSKAKTAKRAAKTARAATSRKPAASKPKAAKAAKNATRAKRGREGGKRVSALDAAATVLKKAGSPMTSKAMIEAMREQKLWTSPAGKTPHATLYAAIHREIAVKGDDARFRKVERGLFALNG